MATEGDRPAGLENPVWKVSPRDQQLHLFRTFVGEIAEALCTHTVPIAELAEPEGDDLPRCVPCLLNWGTELSDRHGDRDRYALEEGFPISMLNDDQLKTALSMLGVSCDQICREIEADQFDNADRHELADTLNDLAVDVRPESL